MKFITVCLSLLCLISCSNQSDAPDISNISVDLKPERFEKDLFAIDTNNIKSSLDQLAKKYPDFLPLYVNYVLGLGPLSDTNMLAFDGIKLFIRLNSKPYIKSTELYDDFSKQKKQLTKAFQYCKYYFPEYTVPKIITTVGPMDALAPMSNNEPSPNFMGKDFIAIGLQFYLGKDFEIYNDPDYISQIAPSYRSRRFEKEYIVSDIMKLVIDDLYPDSSNRLPFAEQMVERGKRVALLKRLLPDENDSILLGYTGAQLSWAEKNERSIYNYFTQNGLLYERDPILIRPYFSDAPFTREFGEESPGNLGVFIGWKMTEAYLEKTGEKRNIQSFMKTPAQEIIKQSNYK
ncbi:MAG: hypothetical protein ACK55K_00595, partial [Bacteroidota bacterium]